MSAVRCEGLSKSFGKVVALRDLDLTLEPKTVFGYLGPNGAGKTTTIRLLVGLARPTRGRAWVAGQEITLGWRFPRQQIGYLPEDPAFYNWMTGEEFLTYVGRLFSIPGRELNRRVAELLELVDLQEAAKRRVGGYSKGMKQRLGIAQALINKPSVLFLDEPSSGLDPMGRRDVLALIDRLREEATVFMSTHILADVERVCDTVGIIDRGQLLMQAGREELREKYASPVFEVEFDKGSGERISGWADDLRNLSWVDRVESEGDGVKVFAGDVAMAKRELPRLVAASDLALVRYELARPSLEDVFVRLVQRSKRR